MKLLLIEDDLDSARDILAEVSGSYSADVAYTGSDGARFSQTNDYDVVIVDSTLPDVNEYDICRRVRTENKQAVILFMLGDSEVANKIKCLDSGADDYLPKPLNYSEFSAKLRAITRKKRGGGELTASLTCGDLHVDFEQQVASVFNTRIALRRKEYDILTYLVLNEGKVVTREKLLRYVWKDDSAIFSNTVDVHIKSIRDKIEKPFGKKFIKTIRGFGYSFAAE